MEQTKNDFIAYRVGPFDMKLRAASHRRDWIDQTDQSFANRCLPMLIANQAGWQVLADRHVRAKWRGGNALPDVIVEQSGDPPYSALSHFGHGILTFTIPFLFRTVAGTTLLMRGPANSPKDAIAPLEGIVETEWSVATATMNWKFTRKHTWIEFARGEPICTIVPQKLEILEGLRPRVMDIKDNPETHEAYKEWNKSRGQFLANLRKLDPETVKQKWQRHYFQGTAPRDGSAPSVAAPAHRTQLKLAEFVENTSMAPASPDLEEIPTAREILNDLLIIEKFIGDDICRSLIGVHNRFADVTARSDNGFNLATIQQRDQASFRAAQTIIARITALIRDHFHEDVGCDLALLCAITGKFRHRLHADNTKVVCPTHGSDAEQLLAIGCECKNIQLTPNHTPWRAYTALLYLESDHRGGNIVFGEAPNRLGGIYRKEIEAVRGLLVLSPSNHLYHHKTTTVTKGVRYSMNMWFTSEQSRISGAWQPEQAS